MAIVWKEINAVDNTPHLLQCKLNYNTLYILFENPGATQLTFTAGSSMSATPFKVEGCHTETGEYTQLESKSVSQTSAEVSADLLDSDGAAYKYIRITVTDSELLSSSSATVDFKSISFT